MTRQSKKVKEILKAQKKRRAVRKVRKNLKGTKPEEMKLLKPEEFRKVIAVGEVPTEQEIITGIMDDLASGALFQLTYRLKWSLKQIPWYRLDKKAIVLWAMIKLKFTKKTVAANLMGHLSSLPKNKAITGV